MTQSISEAGQVEALLRERARDATHYAILLSGASMDTSVLSEFYRQLHTGNKGDIDFYLRACGSGKTILELGCGWGRVAQHLLSAGNTLVGVDQNETFLEAARNELKTFDKASFLQGDVRSLDLLGPQDAPLLFDRILLPYNMIYALGGANGIRRCMDIVKRHLAPSGEMWCDFYPMDELHAALLEGQDATEDDDDPVAEFSLRGHPVRILEASTLDVHAQHLEVSYRAITASHEEIATLTMSHDYLILPQLRSLLDQAGLVPLVVFGDFDGGDLDEPTQIILGASHLGTEVNLPNDSF